VHIGARASDLRGLVRERDASAITARRRGHERHGAAYDVDKEQLS
jgi:hypothetical protein